MLPFFISIPHSGEKVPAEASWLSGLEEPILMCDVDRFVDDLYRPGIEKLQIPSVVAEWHRYVVDLNRLPDDVDASSVTGHPNAAGKFTTGLLWVKTTTGIQLMPNPISATLHQSLVQKYFEPFHAQVRSQYESFKKLGHKTVYHLDAHSMPSRGTAAHRDPGADRPQIVVSDCDGTSCPTEFKDLVISAYERAGFQVAYNWPYKGGRVTQTYGKPEAGQWAIQVELNRSLYMDEKTKKKNASYDKTRTQIGRALEYLVQELKEQSTQ